MKTSQVIADPNHPSMINALKAFVKVCEHSGSCWIGNISEESVPDFALACDNGLLWLADEFYRVTYNATEIVSAIVTMAQLAQKAAE